MGLQHHRLRGRHDSLLKALEIAALATVDIFAATAMLSS